MELIRKPRLLAVNNIALLAPLRSVQCACTCRVVSCAHARTYTSLIHHTNPLFSTHAHAHAHAPHYDIEVDTQWMTVCAGVFRSHCDLLSSFCLTFYLLFLFYFLFVCIFLVGLSFSLPSSDLRTAVHICVSVCRMIVDFAPADCMTGLFSVWQLDELPLLVRVRGCAWLEPNLQEAQGHTQKAKAGAEVCVCL